MLLPTRRHTVRLGHALAACTNPGDLLLLSGELGAGKTFLARAWARALGVGRRVTSPTFVLVNEYMTSKGLLLHADLYRLRDTPTFERDVLRLGLRERRDEGAIVLVEWGDEAERLLGGPAAITVVLRFAGERGREVSLQGPRAQCVEVGVAVEQEPR